MRTEWAINMRLREAIFALKWKSEQRSFFQQAKELERSCRGKDQQSLRWYGSGLTDFWMIGKFDLPDWCNGGKFLSGLFD
ncbi:MAG: hypothetical protein LW628_00945 [Fimbriimonadaceae bacterium]|nr:hypothetical protein [Fimbriimonadaceae bacterium]